MALQGTIDAFPLTDVLHLLSSSSKTGRLVLDGDRGSATLWIDEGRVVGGEPSPASATAESLVFELLRFHRGSFVFDVAGPDDGPAVEVPPSPLSATLEAAGALLEEWRSIEAVVPSTRHRVALVPTLPRPSVTVEETDWPLIVAAGRRPTVDELLGTTGLGEYDGCAAIAALVANGLIEVLEPAETRDDTAAIAASTSSAANGREAPGSATTPDARPDVRPREAAAFPDRFPIDDLVGDGEGDGGDPWPSDDDATESETPATATASTPDDGAMQHRDEESSAPDATDEDAAWDELIDDALDAAGDDGTAAADSADEVLRQMSRLSPQAAEAIAAALHTGSGSRDVEDGNGPDEAASFMGSL